MIFLFHLLAVVNTKEVHFYIRHIGCCQRHSKVDFKTKRRLYLATHPVLGAFYVIFKTIHFKLDQKGNMNSARLSENLSYIFANNKVTGQPL